MVAGELRGDVTAQQSDESVADAFMEGGGDRDGQDGHADYCRLAIRFGHHRSE